VARLVVKAPSCGLEQSELEAKKASRRSLGDRAPSWRATGVKEGDSGE
jgi:hypothetical protein